MIESTIINIFTTDVRAFNNNHWWEIKTWWQIKETNHLGYCSLLPTSFFFIVRFPTYCSPAGCFISIIASFDVRLRCQLTEFELYLGHTIGKEDWLNLSQYIMGEKKTVGPKWLNIMSTCTFVGQDVVFSRRHFTCCWKER